MATWALAISILALVVALGRWIADWWVGSLPWRARGGRHERVRLRVELLADGTNCFVVRGASSVIFLSIRVYNQSEQREADVMEIWADVRVGRHWRRLERHQSEDAYIFGSLVRNALPEQIAASQFEDLYEAYEWPELISRTAVRVRVSARDDSGQRASVEDTLSLRLDSRPPLDILFQTLDVR